MEWQNFLGEDFLSFWITIKIDCNKAKYIRYFNTVQNKFTKYIHCDNPDCIFNGDRSERFSNICNLSDKFSRSSLETINGKEIVISIKEK